MKRVSATGRADLLRALLTADGDLGRTAAELHYERSIDDPTPPKRAPADAQPLRSEEPAVADHQEFSHEPVRPTVLPPLRFLVPARIEQRPAEPPLLPRGTPLSDRDLEIDRSRKNPPIAPLLPWSRLGPFLRRRIGRVIEGQAVDLRRLLRQIAQAAPLRRLPRRRQASWSGHVVLLCDVTPEMYPFLPDMDWLLRRLARERGVGGLTVLKLARAPRSADLARIPREAVVLAISALGQFERSESAGRLWRAVARRLAQRGQAFFALTPVPTSRWEPRTGAAWKSVVWDRGQRLPRFFARAAAERSRSDLTAEQAKERAEAQAKVTDFLLTVLAPASRVEPPLLRASRLILGPPADAGTEWDAWHHEACWPSLRCFGFEEGEAYERRLIERRHLQGREAEQALRVAALMEAHHANCSSVVAAEARLRTPLGAVDAATVEAVRPVLESAVARLRLLAADPGSAAGRNCGLAEWFREMVALVDPTIRQEDRLKELVAAGLAYAHAFEEKSGAELPLGLDAAAYRRAAQEIGKRFEPREFDVDLNEGNVQLVPRDAAEFARSRSGRLSASRPSILLRFADGRVLSRRLDSTAPTPLPGFSPFAEPVTCEIETDRTIVRLESAERPKWAESVAYDDEGLIAVAYLGKTTLRLRWTLRELGGGVRAGRWEGIGRFGRVQSIWGDEFGLAAEFFVGSVSFVMRWIPPGKFLMGSPEDEPGRWPDEGPQHEVTISRGFWLGETPVTQAQWAALVRSEPKEQKNWLWKALGIGKSGPPLLNAAPSHFHGEDCPVEQVSFEDIRTWLARLGRPAFRLPTEAEWEYACRAGTQGAFGDGSACTEPEGLDPALDRLGWFAPNSRSTTQPVKSKAANAWGLYDMHGNVREWCADGQRAYRAKAEVDPTGSQEEGAGRVVRGGTWPDSARFCRAAYRGWNRPGDRGLDLGFRLAAGQELTESEPGAAEPPGAERPRTTEGRGSAPAPKR